MSPNETCRDAGTSSIAEYNRQSGAVPSSPIFQFRLGRTLLARQRPLRAAEKKTPLGCGARRSHREATPIYVFSAIRQPRGRFQTVLASKLFFLLQLQPVT